MMNTIGKIEAEEALWVADLFGMPSDHGTDLGMLLEYYKFQWGLQCSGKLDELLDAIGKVSDSPVPEGCAITCILEFASDSGFRIEMLDAIKEKLFERFGQGTRLLFYAGIGQEEGLPLRLSIICHGTKRRRRIHSEIKTNRVAVEATDMRITHILDQELERNHEDGALVALTGEFLVDFVEEDHLLWVSSASSNTSEKDVFMHLRSEMLREVEKNNVHRLILFIDADKNYTTLGQIGALKERFAEALGEDVQIAMNLRLKDSHVRSITCRSILVGEQKLHDGDVIVDGDNMEILLYCSEDKKEGHMVIGSYRCQKFTLSRYDWGKFDYNRRGETDDHHYFDESNTHRLHEAFRAVRPETLLKHLKRSFESPSADYDFLEFCRKRDIKFESDYNY